MPVLPLSTTWAFRHGQFTAHACLWASDIFTDIKQDLATALHTKDDIFNVLLFFPTTVNDGPLFLFFASAPCWGQQFHHPSRWMVIKHLCHQNCGNFAVINFFLSELLYSWTPFNSRLQNILTLLIHSLWSFLAISSWSIQCLCFFDLTPTKPRVQLNHQPTLFNTLDQ